MNLSEKLEGSIINYISNISILSIYISREFLIHNFTSIVLIKG